MEVRTLKLLTDYAPPTLYVRCVGELDHHCARQVMELIERAMDRYLPAECALDMSALSFMDSSGIALILRLRQRMQQTRGTVWISRPMPQPRKVLRASGIERVVEIKN